MKHWILFPLIAAVVGCATSSQGPVAAKAGSASAFKKPWRGIHTFLNNTDEVPLLERTIKEVLAPSGVNVLVLEVNYNFAYKSHPELTHEKAITKDDARALAALCREYGIRLIPQFNCFGHQSWATTTHALLQKYPELDVSPEIPSDDKRLYCRSWNPLHPRTNEIVFALFDELIDAFQADAFHVGMDEIFLFPEAGDPYYSGETHAQVLAKAANDYHAYLTEKKGVMMLMWGDRLLDKAVMPYHNYESSTLATADAIDMIPKDIIICDWHYDRTKDYPSVRYFQSKGFRVWPSSWRPAPNAVALFDIAHKDATKKMIGHLCTTWCGTTPFCQALLGENTGALSRETVQAAEAFRMIAAKWGR